MSLLGDNCWTVHVMYRRVYTDKSPRLFIQASCRKCGYGVDERLSAFVDRSACYQCAGMVNLKKGVKVPRALVEGRDHIYHQPA